MNNNLIPESIKNFSKMLDDGVILTNIEGTVILANSNAKDFLGKNIETLSMIHFKLTTKDTICSIVKPTLNYPKWKCLRKNYTTLKEYIVISGAQVN